MEQFLKNFFNDNSVCVGLCDLSRKTVDVKPVYEQQLMNAYVSQQKYSQPQVQNYFSSQPVQVKQSVYTQPKSQPQQVNVAPAAVQKPKKQSLAQKFAAQQREYAAQQAYIAQQRQKYAAQQAAQQTVQQRTVQQKPVYSEAKPLYVNPNSYIQQAPQQYPQSRVIVNGNKKKVISAAVPAARYQ